MDIIAKAALAQTRAQGPVAATIAALSAMTITADVNRVTVAGYYGLADRGTHIRKRGASTDPGAIQSADGAWWSYAPLNGNDIHVLHFGAACNGVTDDTAAINAAIAMLTQIAGAFGNATAAGSTFRLVFPAGRCITRGGHVIPASVKASVVGQGRQISILYLKAGANTFLLDVQGEGSSVTGLWFAGNRANNPTGLEGLRINAAYCTVRDVWISDCGGDGLSVGQSLGAIACNFHSIRIRLCIGHGVNVYAGTSTDCQWSDVDVGTCGKSGFYLGAAAQQISNCHSWGNGLEDAADRHGFNIVSGGHMLVNCEGESNLGCGAYVGAGIRGVQIVGGTWWGNVANGIYFYGNTHCSAVGASIRNNGVANTTGSSSVSFANVCFGNCTYNSLVGCNMYDDGTAMPAGSYGVYTPTYTYPGRAYGTFTVYAHYAEQAGSNFNTIVGNVMPASQSRSGNAYVGVGAANRTGMNVTGEVALATLASAATITIPAERDLVQITGTTAITSITAAAQGRRVTLLFASAGCTVTAGSNLSIGASYTSTAGSALTLICDGATWYRIN